MHRILILIGFLLFSFPSLAQEKPAFHSVKAQPNDGIYSLLRRYQLADHQSNHSQFLSLNSMKKNDHLVVGKEYVIPVYIYTYNGRSIRSTIGDSNLKKAKRIQGYNETLLAKGLRKTKYSDSKILWVPHHELHETKKTAKAEAKKDELKVPESKEPRIYPIFGKDHEHVPLIDRSLAGQVFYLVTGHGGPDPGAIGVRHTHRMCEDEYAYDVALRLCKKLLERGAVAYMIIRDPNDGIRSGEYLPCDTDELTWVDKKIPLGQKKRLQHRSDAINKLYKRHKKQGVKNQTALMIHIDSRSAQARADLFFYHHKKSKSGKERALKMQSVMKAKYKKHRANGKYTGTVSARNLYVLNRVKATSVYIEMGNIMNQHDQLRFTLEKNREALAKWLYEGLVI